MKLDQMIIGKRLLLSTEISRAENRGIDVDDLRADLDFAVACFETVINETPSQKLAYERSLMACLDTLHRKILARLNELPKVTSREGELALF